MICIRVRWFLLCSFFPNPGQGFRFHSGGLGVALCSLDVEFTSAIFCTCPREGRMAVPMVSSASRVIFGIAQSRFTWQAWHCVTFTRVGVDNRLACQAQYCAKSVVGLAYLTKNLSRNIDFKVTTH